MPIDFTIAPQALAAANAGVSQGADSSAARTGMLLGGAVVVEESPMSLLADAAEELTFGADTTEEFELSERKERDRVEESLAQRVQLYQELMHQTGKTREMENLGKNLRTVRDRIEARKEAERQFPDPSDAWAALGEALQTLEQDGTPKEVIDAVRAARQDIEDAHGPAIKAGIHGALEAAGYTDLGTSDALRDLYRHTVCEFTTVTDVFATVKGKYGEAGFDRAVDFLYAALGADMGTEVPSMEKAHMETVNTSLGQLRLLQSAHAQCERLLQRWEEVHGVTDAKESLSSMTLLGDIVGLREERFLGAMHIDRIADKAKAPDIERTVLFLQEMLTMARAFPSGLFDGDAGRAKVIDAVQEAVDQAITREDEFLAAQG